MMRQIVLGIEMSDADREAGASGPDLALYIDHADFALLVLGADGRVRFVNQEGCDLLGYPRERLIGRDWFETCIPEPDRADARLAFRRSLERGDAEAGAAETVLTGSGSLRRIAWRSRVFRDAGGAVLGAVRSGAAAPERRPRPHETSWSLPTRENFPARARLLFDSCRALVGARAGFLTVFEEGGGALILDPGAGGRDVESSLSALVGSLRAGSYPGDGAAIENDLPGSRWGQVLPSGGSALGNILIAPLLFEGSSLGLLGFVGKPKGFTGDDAALAAVFADIVALAFNDAEIYRQLVDSERRYHTLAEIAPVGIFRTDRSGDCVYVNSYWAAITGVPLEEALGKGWERALHPDDRDRVLARWSDVLGGKCEFQEEYRFLRPDGAVFWVLGSGTRETNPEGEPIGYVRTTIDITERKRDETALKMVNKKLNLLSSITRHDILNQLTVLLGSMTLLIDDVRDPDTVRMLGRSMDAARTIERQILFTRDYEEIGVNAPRWFDVEETVRVAASGLPEALRILAADVGDLEVYADPLLQKVFYNLVENALRHGGAVTRIGVSAEPSGNDLVLVFEDDGAGVPAGLKEQIFRREYYVHTGFGLFLSREILAITGIAIRETGTPGKGARFELLVPGGAFRYR